MSFARKYDATPFNAGDRDDALADAARRAVLQAFLDAGQETNAQTGADMQAIMTGMIVGVVSVMRAQVAYSDTSDAAIRSSIINVVPWAVDFARANAGLPPLSDA